MKKMLVLFFLMLFSMSGIVSAQSDDMAQQLEDYLSSLTDLGFSGVVLIVDDGQIILDSGYGLANTSTDELNDADTIFSIGSITKLFTATAVLQLHEAGLLNVEDLISSYLDDVPQDKADITIEQILNMMGGFPAYHDSEGDFQRMTRAEAYEVILNAPLVAAPGTEYNYSNSGYTLLAILIEVVSRQSYQDYVREHILTPLDMTRTGFRGEAFDNVAYAKNTFDGYGAPTDWEYSWALVGNGGMVSTNVDLYRFMTALLNFELVSPETMSYWVDLSEAEGWIGLAGGGSSSDYNAAIHFNLDEAVFIFNMTNTIPFPAEFVNSRLEQIIEGEEVPFPPATSTDTVAVFNDCYPGTYVLESGGIFEVTTDENGLLISAVGQDAVNVLMSADNPSLQAKFSSMSERADAITVAVSEGNFAPLADAFDVDIPESELAGLWLQLENEHGALQSHRVLGTSATLYGEDELLTLVQLNFSEATVYVQMFWNVHDELVGFGIEESAQFAQRRLFHVAEHSFATFVLLSDDNPTVIFTVDAGNLSGLRLSSANGDIKAIREGPLCEMGVID